MVLFSVEQYVVVRLSGHHDFITIADELKSFLKEKDIWSTHPNELPLHKGGSYTPFLIKANDYRQVERWLTDHGVTDTTVRGR